MCTGGVRTGLFSWATATAGKSEDSAASATINPTGHIRLTHAAVSILQHSESPLWCSPPATCEAQAATSARSSVDSEGDFGSATSPGPCNSEESLNGSEKSDLNVVQEVRTTDRTTDRSPLVVEGFTAAGSSAAVS